jgi:hypothetical protein
MPEELLLQGRRVTSKDIGLIKRLIAQNPTWHRTRLSKELCRLWDWYKSNGQMKDMACRSILRKLDQRGLINLPKPIRSANNQGKNQSIQPVFHDKSIIACDIRDLYPISIQVIEKGYDLKLFKYLISAYHYLGWSGTVGENLKYLVLDNNGGSLGCVMFGAAAWKVAPRDKFIGWSRETREKNLGLIANNNRFLIPPWVKVKHLASHALGLVSRRIAVDWMDKYHHPIYLLETFVDNERFKGTCYKAANWQYVGNTQGRGKLDKEKAFALTSKSILLYPLVENFRKHMISI